jgi:hypothetical protein
MESASSSSSDIGGSLDVVAEKVSVSFDGPLSYFGFCLRRPNKVNEPDLVDDDELEAELGLDDAGAT